MMFGVFILKWLTEIVVQVYTVSRIENCGGDFNQNDYTKTKENIKLQYFYKHFT